MKFNKLFAAFAVVAMISFASCDKDKGKAPDPLTPTESQAKLEDIGIALANEIKYADFQEVIDLMTEFAELSETLDEDDVLAVRATTNSLKKVVSKNDLNAFTGLLKPRTKALTDGYYNEYYKTFTHNGSTGEWAESTNTSALELRFKSNGKDAVISATVSPDYYTVTADGEEAYVPKSATTSVKLGGTEILNFTIAIPALSSSSDKITATLTHAKSSIVWSGNLDIAQNGVTMSITMKKGSKTLISGKATSDVNGLTLIQDGDELNDLMDDYEEDVPMPGKVVYDMNVMDQLFLRAECNDP
jgi:hypothetical protein